MTDLRKAAEQALYVWENESPRQSVEKYLLEQHAITFLKKALAQPEQDKRKWIGLTGKEKAAIFMQAEFNDLTEMQMYEIVEAKLKEKNYGL